VKEEKDEDYSGNDKDDNEEDEKEGKDRWIRPKKGVQIHDSVVDTALTLDAGEDEDFWDKPIRCSTNCFPDIPVNPLESFETDDEATKYLPSQLTSATFRTKTKAEKSSQQFTATDFHKIHLFESEITDSVSGNNIINVGGPVSSMAWHPSGNYLAVTTLNNYKEKPNILEAEENPTCIQFYQNSFEPDDKNSFNGLSLELLIAFDNGFVHHLQWSSFWPLKQDSNRTSSPQEDFIGHVAYACGDSNLAIMFIRQSYFDGEPNLSVKISPDMSKM
jgi:hypothetical protein